MLSVLGQWAEEKAGEEPLLVAVVGLTNVRSSQRFICLRSLLYGLQAGKSSFVNSLVRKAALTIYQLKNPTDGSSTTTYAQEISLEASGKTIRLIDTPGFLWMPKGGQPAEEVEATRAKDILVRNKGRIERFKDPLLVGEQIVYFSPCVSVSTAASTTVQQIVSRATQEDLMLFYNLPAFADKDTNGFLSALAKSHGLVKKVHCCYDPKVLRHRSDLRTYSTGCLTLLGHRALCCVIGVPATFHVTRVRQVRLARGLTRRSRIRPPKMRRSW